jgi:hypothetical protein
LPLYAGATEDKIDHLLKNAGYATRSIAKAVLKDSEIAAEISAMGVKALYIHRYFSILISAYKSTDEAKPSDLKLFDEIQDEMSRQHAARLKEILKEYSWKTIASMGKEAVKGAYITLKYSNDLHFQIESLEKVKPLITTQKIWGFSYAYLYDQTQISQNEKQLYGPKFKCIKNQIKFSALSDPENIDRLRKQVNLRQSFSEYQAQTIKRYGLKCSKKKQLKNAANQIQRVLIFCRRQKSHTISSLA